MAESRLPRGGLFVCLCCLLAAGRPAWAENLLLNSALNSITVEGVREHVDVLANDTYEGREAGSRGGRAAGVYIGQQLQRNSLPGGGTQGGYYQAFGNGYRNILALLEGSDPELKNEVIVVGAHYDHVGYGNRENSNGPTGFIHNGADDNASGVAGLLETIDAFCLLEARPKRTLFFAFWDGEEKGLLGSYHWVAHPTLPLNRVVMAVNMDMIGRLRKSTLEVYGTRTAQGLRQLISRDNPAPDLLLDFTWEFKDDSDHYPFYNVGIPSIMYHTGLHEDYHRPSDDVERVNMQGMVPIVRLLISTVYDMANRPELPTFRPASRRETPNDRIVFERPLASAPGRLGVVFDAEAEMGPGVVVGRVVQGSPAAAAGLQVGDRIVRCGGWPVTEVADLQTIVLAAAGPLPFEVERGADGNPQTLTVTPTGNPVRIGISWRSDEADPHSVMVVRVVGGSPADRAGLRLGDRIYEVAGESFDSSDAFAGLMARPLPIDLLLERMGRIQHIRIDEPTLTGENAARSHQSINRAVQ